MEKDFNSALYYRFLTPFYDRLFQCFLPEKKIRSAFINHLKIESDAKVIDLGCGTASLTIELAKAFKNATIIGVDADETILVLARNKKQLSNLQFAKGNTTQLQFQNQSVDTAITSFLFCNLTDEHKLKTIAEVKRVLKITGRFYIAEWGKPDAFISSMGFYILQLLGGFKNTATIRKGSLPHLLKEAGFIVRQIEKRNTVLGTVYFYEAKK